LINAEQHQAQSSTDSQTKPIDLVSYLKASVIGNRPLSQNAAIAKMSGIKCYYCTFRKFNVQD